MLLLTCIILLHKTGLGAAVMSGDVARKVLQIDTSQSALIPTSNSASLGSSNTANIGLSSAASSGKRIGAIGGISSVGPSSSLSAADTTVIAGVRGSDNLAAGSGGGKGWNGNAPGGNRGYTSAPGRKLLAVMYNMLSGTTAGAVRRALLQTNAIPFTKRNPDVGVYQNRGAISTVSSATQGAGQGAVNSKADVASDEDETESIQEQGLSGRNVLQLSSVADRPTAVAGSSFSVNGVSRSSVTQARPDRDVQLYGTQSGSSGSNGAIGGGNVGG